MMPQSETENETVEPACQTQLQTPGSRWEERPANSYPPGHAPLCAACFPGADRDDSGRAPDYDHSEVTDTVVRAHNSKMGGRRLHRPEGTAEGIPTGRVGPMSFTSEKPRKQLLTKGEVITFRSENRTTGDTWWRRGRQGMKEGNIHVERLRAIDSSDKYDLDPALFLSGFDSVEEWQEEIKSHHGELPRGVLYRVTLRDNE